MVPAKPGEPATWTMTVTVRGTPPEKFLEPAEALDALLSQADSTLRAAGLGHVIATTIGGPERVQPDEPRRVP